MRCSSGTAIVAKLKAARDRKRRETGCKVGGRPSLGEMRPDAVRMAKQLARKRPKGGRRSLREIAAELQRSGCVTTEGTVYGAAAVARMLSRPG
jgi:hypothetical protein